MKFGMRSVWLALVIIIVAWPGPPVRGQSSPPLETVVIDLWPEYDRPEVLVLYRGVLAPGTSLPTQATFALPAYIDTLHVVAAIQNGAMFEVGPETYTLRQEGERSLLILSLTSPEFQFEYYDPVILTRQAETRTLDFQLSLMQTVDQAVIQVQEPFETQSFEATPAIQNSFIGADGLKYNRLERTGLSAGDTLDLSATYQRTTNALSVERLTEGNPSQPAAAEVGSLTGANRNFGYFLIAIGGVLFLGAIGSWWWSRRKEQTLTSRRKANPKLTTKNKPAFCYRCGTQIRTEANFCHQCGAKRRAT
ncbi:MAG: zinc ribbon domain-containing protein [Anaerolineae bacterium]|nr:zinc ribbon domain-containing protein [Anaerolineae bacterium]